MSMRIVYPRLSRRIGLAYLSRAAGEHLLITRQPELGAAVAFRRQGLRSARQVPHDLVKPRLALEADAGAVGERDEAVLDARIVGETAEVTKYAGIGFRAAQPETGGNRQRHLIAAVRKHGSARPAVVRQHLERAGLSL